MIDINWDAVKRFERYHYDTLSDLQAHMLYMKCQGYSVWEYSETDLWAEYEMNESYHGKIKVKDKSDIEFI